MIEVTNLTKRYGKHLAVDRLSFRVEKGQIYGFLGPNGAGKSTTMNIMTGYLAASDGTVVIDGKDIQKEPEAARRLIGYLPEQPPVYMDMTVYEYLKFVSEGKKIPKAKREEEIRRAMEMTWIGDVKDRLIKNLSKGYRQRVGMAQALLGDPEVIILDEPTVGMDPRQIIEIRDLIRSLRQKHTVILSSHILSEVSAVCDRIMIISHGKLVASDTPEGLQNLMRGSEQLLLEVKGSWEEVSTALSTISTIKSVENREKDVDNLQSSVDQPGKSADQPEKAANQSGEAANQSDMAANQSGAAADHRKASGDSTVQITILAKEGEDVREAVFYCLAEHKLPILSMQQQTRTLEDIFLELTEGESEETDGGQDAEQTEESGRGAKRAKKSGQDAEQAAQESSEERKGEK